MSDDLVVRRSDGRVVFAARAFADQQYSVLKRLRREDDDARPFVMSHRYTLVSIAGPLLAIKDEASFDQDAPIPGGYTRFWTIDLRQAPVYRFNDEEPLRPVKGSGALLDLRRLESASVLAAAIGRTGLGARGSDSPASRGVDDVLYDLAQRGFAPGNCFRSDSDVTTSFAVTSATPRGIVVRIGLPGQSYCRYQLTSLDIVLPRTAGLGRLLGSGAIIQGTPGQSVTVVSTGGH